MRRFVAFGDSWVMPIELPYSMLVRDRDLAWSCGQVPLDDAACVLHPGNLPAQTELVCGYLTEILERVDLTAQSIGKLLLYYVSSEDPAPMLDIVADRFGESVTAIPVAVPHFYYDGLLLEVDMFASGELTPAHRGETAGITAAATRAGELDWVTLQGPVSAFSEADPRQYFAEKGLNGALLSGRWFVNNAATAVDLERAGWIEDAGAAVLQPTATVVAELTWSTSPGANAERIEEDIDSVRILARRVERFAWLSARSNDAPSGLVEQTHQIMSALSVALSRWSLDFDNVVKSTTHYVAGSTADELHDNMRVRNEFYRRPGPASTGLPVFALGKSESRVVVDLFCAT